MKSRNWYLWIFIIFSGVFIASSGYWLISFLSGPDRFLPASVGVATGSIALITAVVSLIGTLLTLFLSVRKERREQALAQLALERQRLELEKERLALERLKRELEREKADHG